MNELQPTQEFNKQPLPLQEDNFILQLLASGDRRKATEEIVSIISKREKIRTTKVDDRSEMWVYQNGIYVPEGKTTIKGYCRTLLGTAYTTHLANEVISKIECDTFIEEQRFFEEQNKHPNLLPVKNGLLDVLTGHLHPHTHRIAYFNLVNAEYRQGIDCPKIKAFLRQILRTEEDYDVIQEMLGFCLIREYKYEKAFMLYGSHGRNGKSKLLDLITRFLGPDNVSGVGLVELEEEKFMRSDLHNKLVNISSEISEAALKGVGVFQRATGRDLLTCDRKFKTSLKFVNYAKMVFACNELPQVYTLSDAFWLRWVIVEFPYRFLPQKELDALSSEERVNARLQDQEIVEKITSPDELSGFLNFALEGLRRLSENRDFSSTQTAREIRKDWTRKSNSVSAFIEDHIEESWDTYIPKSDFLKEYQLYCMRHRLKQVSDKQIKNTLKDLLGVSENRPQMDDGSRALVWSGIRFIKKGDAL